MTHAGIAPRALLTFFDLGPAPNATAGTVAGGVGAASFALPHPALPALPAPCLAWAGGTGGGGDSMSHMLT